MADGSENAATALQPRPFPFPLPTPPPSVPQELAAPLSCYKCHSPEQPLPAADSPEAQAADSSFRQTLASTWRTMIDSVESHILANQIETDQLLSAFVEDLLVTGTVKLADLSSKQTLADARADLRELIRHAKGDHKRTIDKVTKNIVGSVLKRMHTPSPQVSVAPFAPKPPPPEHAGYGFAVGVMRCIAYHPEREPLLRQQLESQGFNIADLHGRLIEAYPVWRNLVLELAKRNLNQSLYDVQLMMVGGYALKLLELGWRELRLDDSRGQTIESEQTVGFSRVADWIDAGGVRVALWYKGEKERIEKEKKRLEEQRLIDEQKEQEAEAERLKQQELDEERQLQEAEERQKHLDRYEHVLARLISIEKERRTLLQESVKLEEEREELEAKLNSRSAVPEQVSEIEAQQASGKISHDKDECVDDSDISGSEASKSESTEAATNTVTGAISTTEAKPATTPPADAASSHSPTAPSTETKSGRVAAILARLETARREDASRAETVNKDAPQQMDSPGLVVTPRTLPSLPVQDTTAPISEPEEPEYARIVNGKFVLQSDLDRFRAEREVAVQAKPSDLPDFLQGSSRDLQRLATQSFYSRAPRITAAEPDKKGKGPAPPLECTCGALSRGSSPGGRRLRRPKRVRPGPLSRPLTDPAPEATESMVRINIESGSRLARSPYICTYDEHSLAIDGVLTPPPAPTYVDPAVLSAIDKYFLMAFAIKLRDVAHQQLSLLFHMSTPNMLAKVWQLGGRAAEFAEKGIEAREETMAVDFIIAELAAIAHSRAFQERATKLALKSAFAHVVRECSSLYSDLIAPEFQGRRAACVCVLAHDVSRLERAWEALKAEAAGGAVYTAIPCDEPFVSRIISPLYGDFIVKGVFPNTISQPVFVKAHMQAFDRFRARFFKYRLLEFAPCKQLMRVVRLFDASMIWRLATMQHAAAETAEPRASFVDFWTLISEDALIRQELAPLRTESPLADAQSVSQNIMERVIKAQNGLGDEQSRDDERDIAKLTLAIALYPHQPRLYLARAVARSHLDRPWQTSQVIHDCTMALILPAGLSEFEQCAALSERGLAFLKQGRKEEAEEDLLHHPAMRKERRERSAHRATIKNALPPPPPMLPLTKMVCPIGICQRPFSDCNSVEELEEGGKAVLRAYKAAVEWQASVHYHRHQYQWAVENATKKVANLLLDPTGQKESHKITPLPGYSVCEEDVITWLQNAAWNLVLMVNTGMDPKKQKCICTINDEYFPAVNDVYFYYKQRLSLLELPASLEGTIPDDLLDSSCKGMKCDVLGYLEGAVQEFRPNIRFPNAEEDKPGFREQLLRHVQDRYVLLREALVKRDEPIKKAEAFGLRTQIGRVLDRIGGAHIWVVIGNPSPKDLKTTRHGEYDDLRAWASVALWAGSSHPEIENGDARREAIEHYHEARRWLEEKNYENAIRYYSTSLALEQTPQVFWERAKVVERLLDPDVRDPESRKDILRWIARDCTHAIARGIKYGEVWALRAKATYSLSKPEPAYHDMLRGVTEDPVNPLVFQLGVKAGVDIARTPEVHRNLDPHNFIAPAMYLSPKTALIAVHPKLRTLLNIPLLTTGGDDNAQPTVNGKDHAAQNGPELAKDESTQATTKEDESALSQHNTVSAAVKGDAEANAPAQMQVRSTGRHTEAGYPNIGAKYSYYRDPRIACPPIRCSGAEPDLAALDELDALLLDTFNLAYQIELPERRAHTFSTLRDLIMHSALYDMAWEKRDLDSQQFRDDLENLIGDRLNIEFASGSKRAERGLDYWTSATLLAIKSLTNPSHRYASGGTRDCCVCLLSESIDSINIMERVLRKRAEVAPKEPLPLNKTDLPALIAFCRNEVKKGALANRGGIWRSAPKWKFAVERFATKFEAIFENYVTSKFPYKEYESDYPTVSKLVGGIATFEAAHRLLLHPDPLDAGQTQRLPQAVEDTFPWAAFVSANAPFPDNITTMGDVKTIGLATSKVDEATKLFREAKYLEAIRAYSIAAIWAGDRTGVEPTSVERKYLREEARRTLKSGIYAQLSYLRTLFPSNRQWMNAVADATLAIAYAQKAELQAALDLRSTALHGIRQYKLALSDLEDAAMVDLSKRKTWEDRFAEMYKLVPSNDRKTSEFRNEVMKSVFADMETRGFSKAEVLEMGAKARKGEPQELHAALQRSLLPADSTEPNGGRNEHTSSIETAFATLEEASVLSSYISGAAPAPVNGLDSTATGSAAVASDARRQLLHARTQDFVKLTEAAADHSSLSSAAPSVSLKDTIPDERLACSPVRHNVNVTPDPSQIGTVSDLLREIFLFAHGRCRHQGAGTVLASIENEWFDQFLRSGTLDKVKDVRDETELGNIVHQHILSMLERMRHPSTIAAWGQAFVTQALSWMSQLLQSQISKDLNMPPCICTLTNSVPALQRILDILMKGPLDYKAPDRTPEPDIEDVLGKVRSAIATNVLTGTSWQDEAQWSSKITTAVQAYHDHFSIVVGQEWESKQPWIRGTLYDAVAATVGGVAIWDRAIRIGMEIEERHDGYRDTTPEKARTRSSTFALSGWSEYVSGGPFVKSILEVQKREGAAAAGAHGTRIADECFADGRLEEALAKYICLSMAFNQDPFIWIKLARCRLAMPGKYQRHEAIADCTLGLARCVVPAPALPTTTSERDGQIPSTLAALPAHLNNTANDLSNLNDDGGQQGKQVLDPTSYARADLLLLRAKALTHIERFGLALYDLEALSSSLRREHTGEADSMIKSIKAWISQEQRGLLDLQREARDAALHLDDDECSCCAHDHELAEDEIDDDDEEDEEVEGEEWIEEEEEEEEELEDEDEDDQLEEEALQMGDQIFRPTGH
ncbi:hypothetical protein OIO90_001422 [Microbotryomycetes sp. JL221]|nr:hypothetical protein OIO90_001422 [Microbotryomycetes sp. JL221]